MGNNDEKAAAAAAAMVKCREVRTQDDHNDQRITQIFLSPQLRYDNNFRRFNIIYIMPNYIFAAIHIIFFRQRGNIICNVQEMININ